MSYDWSYEHLKAMFGKLSGERPNLPNVPTVQEIHLFNPDETKMTPEDVTAKLNEYVQQHPPARLLPRIRNKSWTLELPPHDYPEGITIDWSNHYITDSHPEHGLIADALARLHNTLNARAQQQGFKIRFIGVATSEQNTLLPCYDLGKWMLWGNIIDAIADSNSPYIYILPKAYITRGLIPDPTKPISYIRNPEFEASQVEDYDYCEKYYGFYYYDDNDKKVFEFIIDPAILIEGDIENPLMWLEYSPLWVGGRMVMKTPYLAGRIKNVRV